ncbi:MAG: hypothetical protein ACF8R7_12035 [Phycisphaerales bacterium JB039]
MRCCKPVAVSLALVVAAGVMALARQAGSQPVGAAQPEHAEHAEHADGLHEHMEAMEDHLKQVVEAVRAPDGSLDTALEHIAGLQQRLLGAKLLTPESVTDAPAAEQDAMRRDFRRRLALALAELARVEAHLLEGDRDKALALLQGPLHQMEADGHDRYQ